jgi:hypothetical protein
MNKSYEIYNILKERREALGYFKFNYYINIKIPKIEIIKYNFTTKYINKKLKKP